MASNHTPNYSLCQWEPEDKVLRTDFNEDNAKVDRALAGMASSMEGMTFSLDSLKATVGQQSAALGKKGNCQLYTATYVGNGRHGPDRPCSMTFPNKPLVVFITGPEGYQGIFTAPSTLHYVGRFGYDGTVIGLIWNGNTLQWYGSSGAFAQMNASGETYYVTALLQAD